MMQESNGDVQLLGRQSARRSILKNTVLPVKRGSTVTWDESMILEHDKDRGTRTVIDEPKTPYIRCESNEEFSEEHAQETGCTKRTLNCAEAAAGGVDPSEVASRLGELTDSTGAVRKPKLLKGMSFEERRKAHYLTEFNRAKREVTNGTEE